MLEYRFPRLSLWAMALRAPSDGAGTVPPSPPAAPPVTPPPAPPVAPPASVTVPWVEPSKPWMAGDKPWHETYLTDGPTKELVKAKNYANPQVLADAYYSLNKAFNERENGVALPPDNATPEQIAEFHQKLGRPPTPEGYKDVKWGDNADPAMVAFGTDLAFKLGLSPKAVEATLLPLWNEFAAKANSTTSEQQLAANTKAIGDLETSWGPNLEANRTNGQRVLQSLVAGGGITEADVAAVEAHIGAAPLVKMLAAIGKLSAGEGALLGGRTDGGGGNVVTREQATQKIATLQSDASFMAKYSDKEAPGHKEAVAEMLALHEKTL